MAVILGAPDVAEEAVMSVHNALVARGLARFSVFDIPVAAEMPYEMLAANRLAPVFDKQANPNDEVLATRTLVQIIALPTSGETTRVEYF
jgi:predicted deacylase